MSEKRIKRRKIKSQRTQSHELYDTLKPYCDELARKGVLLVSPAVHRIIRTLQEAQAVIE